MALGARQSGSDIRAMGAKCLNEWWKLSSKSGKSQQQTTSNERQDNMINITHAASQYSSTWRSMASIFSSHFIPSQIMIYARLPNAQHILKWLHLNRWIYRSPQRALPLVCSWPLCYCYYPQPLVPISSNITVSGIRPSWPILLNTSFPSFLSWRTLKFTDQLT